MLLDTDGVASAFAVPTGTVTLVLTDVEESASLWQDHADVMGAVIARHYEILDAAMTMHGGVRPVEQGEGDSVVAAFARASDAAAAVLDAQLAFAGEPWPDGIELRVRMAVHTGEVELRDEGNYVGNVVNQCARLRSIAHGGQVLVSDTTATLLRDRIPDSAWLVDLGSHRLRSLARVERVWQLCHHDLRREFPPLRSEDIIVHNLPTPLSSFVGRQRELVQADELLGAHRLVTMTGSGGVGKTRLALEAAGQRSARYPGGVWWVDLAAVTEADGPARALAAVLGIRESAGSAWLRQVVDRLSVDDRAALVVLDNCEHVVDGAASLAQSVLDGSREVSVLATSRELLGVPGEVAWRVPSMTTPDASFRSVPHLEAFDAALLFLERARQARPNLALDDRASGPRCRHLHPVGGHSAGDRARRGARALALARSVGDRSQRCLPSADRWCAHGAASPADVVRVDRVERRPPRC